MKYDYLKTGTEIYYTGDMSNTPSFGVIVKIHGNDFYPILYDIFLNEDEERLIRNITPINFEKSPGRRFMLRSEYDEERRTKIENLKTKFSSV